MLYVSLTLPEKQPEKKQNTEYYINVICSGMPKRWMNDQFSSDAVEGFSPTHTSFSPDDHLPDMNLHTSI